METRGAFYVKIMEDILDAGSSQKDIVVNGRVSGSLNTAAVWAKFLSIFQIVVIGLGMIMGLIAIIANPIVGFVAVAVYGFMMYTAFVLLQFGNSVKSSLQSSSQSEFEVAMEKLGLWFKIIGIMTIVIIGLYIVMFAVIGTTGAMMFNRF